MVLLSSDSLRTAIGGIQQEWHVKKTVVGFIVAKMVLDNGEVIPLIRGNEKRGRRWGADPVPFSKCYVHSIKSVRRAIWRRRPWVMEATVLIRATFDPESKTVIPGNYQITFDDYYVEAQLKKPGKLGTGKSR